MTKKLSAMKRSKVSRRHAFLVAWKPLSEERSLTEWWWSFWASELWGKQRLREREWNECEMIREWLKRWISLQIHVPHYLWFCRWGHTLCKMTLSRVKIFPFSELPNTPSIKWDTVYRREVGKEESEIHTCVVLETPRASACSSVRGCQFESCLRQHI